MDTGSFQTIADKAQFLQDYEIRFEGLLERAEAHESKRQTISLPEFEAFGWNRLGEFLDRFEESMNSPLLEGMRQILESAGISLNSERIERLKAGLVVRREGLVEIARRTIQELEKIALTEIRGQAKADIGTYIEEGKWDGLIERINGWHKLGQQLDSIAAVRDKNTLLYNAVFDLALEEGQFTKLAQQLTELEELAHRLGGDLLKQRIRFETPESLTNPMGGVETSLNRIAQEKEEIRQLQGEDIDLKKFIDKPATLKEVIEVLRKRRDSIGRAFRQKRDIAQGLVDKHNNLASLLGKSQVSLPDQLDLNTVEALVNEFKTSNTKLLDELEKGLAPNARVFIEHIIDGKLPPKWAAQQTFSAIQELLSKGFFFEVKRRGVNS